MLLHHLRTVINSLNPRWGRIVTGFSAVGLALGALAACAPGAVVYSPTTTEPPSIAVVVVTEGAPSGIDAAVAVQSAGRSEAEIRSLVPYAVRLPAWAPAGYVLQPEVGFAADDGALLLQWRHESGGTIDLVIGQTPPALPSAPPRLERVIDLNGQPGLLIFCIQTGSNGDWDPAFQLMLVWQQEDVHYTLAAAGRGASRQALTEMARSFT